jgi:hypothetical protein
MTPRNPQTRQRGVKQRWRRLERRTRPDRSLGLGGIQPRTHESLRDLRYSRLCGRVASTANTRSSAPKAGLSTSHNAHSVRGLARWGLGRLGTGTPGHKRSRSARQFPLLVAVGAPQRAQHLPVVSNAPAAQGSLGPGEHRSRTLRTRSVAVAAAVHRRAIAAAHRGALAASALAERRHGHRNVEALKRLLHRG